VVAVLLPRREGQVPRRIYLPPETVRNPESTSGKLYYSKYIVLDVRARFIRPEQSQFWTTVVLISIRQSRVTGVLDATNFATLSRVTEALDEHTFRHGRFKISVQECLEQSSLAVDTSQCSHSISCPFRRFLASNLTNIVVQSKFNH
jgi:hypothetical protein